MRRTGERFPAWLAGWALVLALGLPAGVALAIDNPDRPNPMAEFASRAGDFETRIAGAGTDRDALAVYAQYEQFLDRELNLAYTALVRQGRDSRRQDLVRSQKSWLIFRDAEMRFIANNWTPQDFGSSSATSRAAYRAALIRGRVETLLGYLRSYPPGGLVAPAH